MSLALNYPQIALGRAVKYLEDHKENILKSGIITRNDALIALDFKPRSGAGETVAGSLIRYGFLDKADEKYKFSASTKLILEHANDIDIKRQLVLEAAQKPSIFSSLWQLQDKLGQLETNEAEKILTKHSIPKDKFKHALKNYRLTRDFYFQLGNKKVETKDIPLNKPGASSKINDDQKKPDIEPMAPFEFNGQILNIPKRLVLRAYIEWLQDMQSSLESDSK